MTAGFRVGRILKDPQAELTYGIAWAEWLQNGDTLASATWTVPTGIEKESDGINTTPLALDVGGEQLVCPTGTVTLIRLSGGTHGTDYRLTCHIVTAAGDEDDRSLTVACRNR
jgi:hypothetical protein